MSSLVDLDDEIVELCDQIRMRLKVQRSDVVAAAIALLAARLRMRVIERETE